MARLIGQRPSDRCAAYEAVREAIRELIPRDQRGGTGITAAVIVQVMDRAKALIRQLNLVEDEHDASALEKLLALACRWLLKTYQPTKAGADVWWELQDLEQASAVLRGMVSNDANAGMIGEAQAHRIAITPQQMRTALPVAWLAAAKDILSIGKVRVTAVEGALRWSNLPCRRSQVAILLTKLRGLGLIECTDARYGPGCARKYAIRAQSFTLPFVIAAVGDHRRQCEAKMLAQSLEQNPAHAPRLQHVAKLTGLPAPHFQECLDTHYLPEVSRRLLGVPDWSLWASVEAICTQSPPSFAF